MLTRTGIFLGEVGGSGGDGVMLVAVVGVISFFEKRLSVT